jgi:hypothetical protein
MRRLGFVLPDALDGGRLIERFLGGPRGLCQEAQPALGNAKPCLAVNLVARPICLLLRAGRVAALFLLGSHDLTMLPIRK